MEHRDPYLRELGEPTYLVIDPRAEEEDEKGTAGGLLSSLEGPQMRPSLLMTRYLESWGAAKPFAHLSHLESPVSTSTPLPEKALASFSPQWSLDRSRTPRGLDEDLDTGDAKFFQVIEQLNSQKYGEQKAAGRGVRAGPRRKERMCSPDDPGEGSRFPAPAQGNTHLAISPNLPRPSVSSLGLTAPHLPPGSGSSPRTSTH